MLVGCFRDDLMMSRRFRRPGDSFTATPPNSVNARTRTSGEPGSAGPPARLSALPPNRAKPDNSTGTPCGMRRTAPPRTTTAVMTDSGASACAEERSSRAPPSAASSHRRLLRRQRPRCLVPPNTATIQRERRAGGTPAASPGSPPTTSLISSAVAASSIALARSAYSPNVSPPLAAEWASSRQRSHGRSSPRARVGRLPRVLHHFPPSACDVRLFDECTPTKQQGQKVFGTPRE
jgi:hypothetical protein